MVSSGHTSPRLGLAEAYHVANRFVAHAGFSPRAIEEPVDGVVELIGSGFRARVRVDAIPLTQGAVLALLRATGSGTTARLMLFSVTGYTTGALVFGDTQGVALFELTEIGEVVARNTHARAVMPAEPLEPAFAEPVVPEDPEADEDAQDDEEPVQVDWRDCPRCGATHHPRANFCASCGADLHRRLTVLGETGGIPRASKLDTRGAAIRPGQRGQAVPQRRPDAPMLRCRTCGSHDIELIDPE